MKREERMKMKKTQDAGKGSAGSIKVDARHIKKGAER
jgi:hypothetical protein